VKTTKGPQLLISRTHPKLVEKLMELEIPEIKAGTVEVKGVAREPGVRCKVSGFYQIDEQVDPIGACVGQNGSSCAERNARTWRRAYRHNPFCTKTQTIHHGVSQAS